MGETSVCPIHEEAMSRVETLIRGEIKTLSAVIGSHMGNQAALNTRFEKLIERGETMQETAGRRMTDAITQAIAAHHNIWEQRCMAVSIPLAREIETQGLKLNDQDKRILALEHGYWKIVGGVAVATVVVNVAAQVAIRFLFS